MTIVEYIRQTQDKKEMTRKVIILLESLGENVDDFKAEFFKLYNENV